MEAVVKRFLMVLTLVLLALLFILQPALAGMSSPIYNLDWLLPLTGSGGPPMSSPLYQLDATLGQTLTGPATGSLYTLHSGYWAFLGIPYTLFLPAIRK